MSMISSCGVVGMGALLCAIASAAAAADEPAPEAKISLQGYQDVQPVEFPWGWIRWLMNSEIDPQAEMTFGVVHINPHQANPLHRHFNSAEFLHVLSGECEHRVGDRWVKLKAGDTLRIPRGELHCARTGEVACRVIVVYDTGTRQMEIVESPPAAD